MSITIYVNINSPTEGNGSKDAPFQNIQEAAKIAVAGDTILVAPGIYREYVCPINAGTEDARITYKSEVPLGAVITGAEELKSWEHYEGNVWKAKVPNSIFGDYNPYTTFVCGDWYFAPTVRHTGAVFINDLMMYETVTLEECIAGEIEIHSWVPEESRYKWFTEQDGDSTVLYANFQGKNPNEENVEISVRRNCFMPDKNGVNYITVSGFNINKAATTWAPPAAYQDGMIGPHWSKGWIIEDCEVSNSRCCGISLGKYRDEENDMYFYTKHVKSPTQMEREPDMNALAKYHFGHLPVWIDGNAYFNGANVYAKEVNKLVNTTDKAEVSYTTAEDGKIFLETNLGKLIKNFYVSLIDSDVLGKAFEPEQRFENPDGSAITFDTDYYGKPRGDKIIPGPFAAIEEKSCISL